MLSRSMLLTIGLLSSATGSTFHRQSPVRASGEAGCSSGFVGDPSASPTIEITNAQPGFIAGRANNVDTDQTRVVLWALTNYWHVQPFIGGEFTEICRDGTWQNSTNQWFRMVALLVGTTAYDPSPGTRFNHPAFEPGVLAWAQVPVARDDLPLRFSDLAWGIKVAECAFDPGPNYFSDSPDNVFVDADGRLHLRNIFEQARPTCAGTRDRWTSSEIYSLDSFGYGTFTVQLDSRVDSLDPVSVFSPFLYERPDREIDIELSRALVPQPDNAQYVVQPISIPATGPPF